MWKKYLVKPNIFIVLAILILSLLPFLKTANIFKDEKAELAKEHIYQGEVLEVLNETEVRQGFADRTSTEQELLVEMSFASEKRTVKAINDFVPVEKGTKVYLNGLDPASEENFYVVDVKRGTGLIWLSLLFITLIVLVGGLKGVYSLVGLVASFSVIFNFIIPGIIEGGNPVTIGIIGSLILLPVSIYVTYGLNRKSFSALIGIGATLLLVGLLASYAVDKMYFSGFGSEEAVYLNQEAGRSLNLVGLLIAGIIIAAIGVLDDIAITQSSLVFTLASHAKNLTGYQLFHKAMEVGRDHISAVVNTLVLAYTGAALPLLLLLSLREFPLGFVLNGEIMAEEIVRTIISSSGLVLAVPITTAIAVWLSRPETSEEQPHLGH